MNKEKMLKLARRMRRIRHEEHYDQQNWAIKTQCGTAACLAGHACLMEGRRFDFGLGHSALRLKLIETDEPIMTRRGALGPVIQEEAKRILGLTETEAELLFSAYSGDWPGDYAERLAKGERPSRVVADMLEALARGEETLVYSEEP